METRFMYNGIKQDGKLYKAYYSGGKLHGFPDETITIYGRRYRDLPAVPGLAVENDSDTMTDYFENDRVRVTPDNPHYPAVLAAYEKQQAHKARVAEKRKARRAA